MSSTKRLFGKTKIVCTLGPASSTVEQLSSMIQAGMDVADEFFARHTRRTCTNLEKSPSSRRRIGRTDQRCSGSSGTEIRIGELQTPSIELQANASVTITNKDQQGNEKILSTTYTNLPKDVKPGDRILLDDGKIELRVLRTTSTDVETQVVTGGILTAHKGINLPGVAVSAPSLTEKDKEDLYFTFEHEVDYIALSFVRRAHDVAVLRDFIIENVTQGTKSSDHRED